MSDTETLKYGQAGTETETSPKPKRTRSAESIEKQKASVAAKRSRLAAVDIKTGLDEDQLAEMDYARRLAEAEARIKEQSISEDNQLMILKEIKVDIFNTSRRYVKLTPSMCDLRDCGFDAALEAGCPGWSEAPTDQIMADGRTFGERLIQMKEYHKTTAHTVAAQTDHIITAGELRKREWSVGNAVKGQFLKGAR